MSQILDNMLQFDVWETLDRDTMELAQTSEFWAQVQYEADNIDLVPPMDLSDELNENVDFRIPDAPEDPPKDKIVHHDCMWSSKVSESKSFVPPDMMVAIPGQSLLRREPSPPRPETPPSADGEDAPEFLHTVDVAGTALRLIRNSAFVAADHSYTLARQQVDTDCLGVQTPSDSGESEEEIDVVSVGNSQHTFTHTPSSRPIIPEKPQYAASEKNHTHRQMETTTVHRPRAPIGRKRLIPPQSIPSASVPRRRRGPGRRGRSNTDTDSEGESPEIERRSIHNDMERLRRIGLKNLFDELKKQIPATKDKERAPKVVILREAAALCRRLREEESEREHERKKQEKLLTKIRKLRVYAAKRYRQY